MTEKEILAMKPGLELNIKVAKEVMKHRVIEDENLGYMERFKSNKDQSTVFGMLQPYSEDAVAASQVVEEMVEKGFPEASAWADFGNGAYTKAEAVCKAALCALLKKRQKTEAGDRILRKALGVEEEEEE
jgi:hypothetical protein